jgi:hypothetical protein
VKLNGAVPWDINAVIAPSLPEPQDVEYRANSTGGVDVIVNGVDRVQPEASVTDSRCCPTLTFVKVTADKNESTILFVPSIE